MFSLRRHRISGSRAARAAGPQNLSAAVRGMRRQGTDTKDGQMRGALPLLRHYIVANVAPENLSCGMIMKFRKIT